MIHKNKVGVNISIELDPKKKDRNVPLRPPPKGILAAVDVLLKADLTDAVKYGPLALKYYYESLLEWRECNVLDGVLWKLSEEIKRREEEETYNKEGI